MSDAPESIASPIILLIRSMTGDGGGRRLRIDHYVDLFFRLGPVHGNPNRQVKFGTKPIEALVLEWIPVQFSFPTRSLAVQTNECQQHRQHRSKYWSQIPQAG